MIILSCFGSLLVVKSHTKLFTLTFSETHIAGVSRCQRIMKETMCELNELKYDMESERSKLGYTDPSRLLLHCHNSQVGQSHFIKLPILSLESHRN